MEKSFRKLEIWKKAHELTLNIYRITANFPKSELYGITSQIRRSASSIPANIAEGHSRNTTKQYINFLSIANGSLAETRYFIILAHDLNYMNDEEYNELEAKSMGIRKMINATMFSLEKKNH